MSSPNTNKKYLRIAGQILLLLIVVLGAIQAGPPASYYDPYGLLFILVGGVALTMISFPGAEIGRALRHAGGGSGSGLELRNSAHFWEAVGRGFWILGGLRSVVSMVLGFISMATVETAGVPTVIPMLIRSLLSTFYGSLLAVICFVPCWIILAKLQSRISEPNANLGEAPASLGRAGGSFGAFIGYLIFLAVLVFTLRMPHPLAVWTVYRPSLLVVLGGTLALILFIGRNNTRLTPSAAFAGMGLIGCLIGFIQMLHGMTDPSPQGIGRVAGALAFILSSCFTALLGMALIGAPIEDRAIRVGRVAAPSAFSRVSWYVFPLLSLIFLVLVFNMIIAPLPPAR